MNFVGVVSDFFINVEFIENGFVFKFLLDFWIVWKFNFFYVLYMGGVWERFIGVLKRVLNVMLFDYQ